LLIEKKLIDDLEAKLIKFRQKSDKLLEKKLSNYFEIVETAFREILASGLSPFVKREMKARYGANWVTSGKISLQSYHVIKGDLNWSDMQAVLKLIINQWNNLFKQRLGYSARGYVSELIEVRNNLKHESRDTFDFDYSYRALDSIERLLFTLPNDHIAESKSREAADRKKELFTTLTIDSVEKKDEKPQSSGFPWHEICGVMLLQKQRDSLRRKATQAGAEVNVYVALDLLIREERSENDGNSQPDKESQKVTYEIEKTFKHNDFLESLTQRQCKNKHIAIAGEAGAGKTTLLATIAEKLHQQGQLTIFISLADLQDKSLYDDIYESWLPRALGLRKGRATEEQKDDLHEQFKLGKVWLLLDGLDEMQSKSSANALVRIESEIGKVVEQSKVVLTCRLNVWDVNLNGLSNFETFRMGKFSQDDVDKFICEWFIKVERPESAPILQAKLKELNRDRIRDMVRHPLRLALLCQAFYLNPNTDLPETKAGLYDRFVPYFYEWNEWKPNIVDEPLLAQDTFRNELHLALGKLAIAGIDGDTGFRLSRNLAVKEMGDRLFELAIKLNWLIPIERDENDRQVYSFFHATFQEYFAALAIQNCKFFLNRYPSATELESYRVFEKKWEEVILFWVGNREKTKESQDLIDSLVDFEIGSDFTVNIFYKIQSDFIAAKCISEFKNYYRSKLVLENLIDRNIGFLEEKEWVTKNNIRDSKEEAKAVFKYISNQLYKEITDILFERLSYSCFFQELSMKNIFDIHIKNIFDRELAYKEFNGFVNDNEMRIKIASEIINISKNNEEFNRFAVNKFKKLLDDRHEPQIRIACAYALLRLDNKSDIGRNELIKLKDNSICDRIQQIAEKLLCEKEHEYIYNDQEKNENLVSAIDQLKDFKVAYETKNVTPQSICQLSWYELIVRELSHFSIVYELKISQSDPLSTIFEDLNLKDFLIKIMLDIVESVTWSLYTITALPVIAFGSQKVINALEDFIDKNNDLSDWAARSLGEVDHGNQKAVSTILKSIKKTIEQLESNPDLTDTDNDNKEIERRDRYRTSWRGNISVNLRHLKYISNNDYSIILSLYDLLKDTTDSETKLNISMCIVSFDPLNSLAISYLVYLFAEAEDYSIAINALIALIECLGWEEALNYTVDYFDNFYTNGYLEEVYNVIKEQITTKDISRFIAFLRLHPSICWEFRDLLWHFSHEITYQEFAQAWESQKVTSDTRSIEKQFMRDIVQTNLDLSSDHPEIRCLVIDIRHLEQGTEPNVIAQKIVNRIFDSLGLEIPIIQNIAVFETVLINLQRKLDVNTLAIALYGNSANEAIDQLCQSLTESIPIHPFIGEQTIQKLIAKIKAWLSEM
jgi:energy-coupling factor transporter ATP-binding protein EcfA2